MRVARWIFCQLVVFPASVLLVLGTVGLFLLSLVEPTVRILVLQLIGQPVGERQAERVRQAPRTTLCFVRMALQTVPLAHAIKIGEI